MKPTLRLLAITGAIAGFVMLASTASATPLRLELGPFAGAGFRHTRGHFDTELLDGYAYQLAADVGLEARLGTGAHALALRGFLQRDLVLGVVHAEHMNAFGGELVYLHRTSLGAKRLLGIVVAGGSSLTRFDAVWDDGLRGLSCLFSAPCFEHLRELRATNESFDHTALGPVVEAGLDARLGTFVLGAGIEQRLLFALGNDTNFVHHVALLQVRGAWASGP